MTDAWVQSGFSAASCLALPSEAPQALVPVGALPDHWLSLHAFYFITSIVTLLSYWREDYGSASRSNESFVGTCAAKSDSEYSTGLIARSPESGSVQYQEGTA